MDDSLRLFQGPEPVLDANRGTLLAINKGRLLRFLEPRSGDYAYLWGLVQAAFLGEGTTSASPYFLIDLNNRTFVGPDYASSLMTEALSRLAEWRGWDACRNCPAADRCPALGNVTLLRSGDSSGSPSQRLWEVFAAADLDDRVHITARHVVTQLARLIGAGRRCAEIRAEARRGAIMPGSAHLYNSLFDPQGGASLGDSSALDEVLATYDPAERDDPQRGRLLHTYVAAADLDGIPADPPMRWEDYLHEEARSLALLKMDTEPTRGDPDYRQRTIRVTHAIERGLYLRGNSPLAPAFALNTLGDFLQIAAEPGAESVGRLLRNLNAALGLEGSDPGGLLSPRDYARGLVGRGFALLLPEAQFSVAPGTGLGQPYVPDEYLETWPRSILLRAHDPNSAGNTLAVATLSIPLLLFEILERAGRGFKPAGQTERAYMVRLRGFYRRLSEHQWSISPRYVLYDAGRTTGIAKISDTSFSIMGA